MPDPTIAVALGAGGARGLAHIAALQAFDEMGIKPAALAGSSMGSLIASAYASGMTGDEVEEFTLDRLELGPELLSRLWSLRAGSFAEFLKSGGLRLGELNVEKIMDVFLPEALPQRIEELTIPAQIVATDYYGHKSQAFETGDLKTSIAASSAIPAVFRPVVINETVYIDGGITNPVPVDGLAGKADILIGIDVAGGPNGTPGTRPGKVDVLYASSQLMQHSIAREMASRCKTDIFLSPRVGGYRVLDFLKAKEILQATAPFKDEVKTAIHTAFETAARQN